MKLQTIAKLFCVLVSFIALSALAQKPIRLRNELIHPNRSDALNAAPRQAAVNNQASGLYLLQFSEHFQSSWQAELNAAGVQLIQYVPEDAFIVRLNHADIQAVKKLRFFHWLGKYRPAHKVHQLVERRVARSKAGELVNVSILVSPAATAQEALELKRLLQKLHQESKHRFGTVIRGGVSGDIVATLANSEAVLWIEPEFSPKLVDEIAAKIVAGNAGPNTTIMMDLGFDGNGVKVAVADSGLHTGFGPTMHPDLAGRTPDFFFYGNLTDAADEHSHGTHVAGIVAGNGATGEIDESGSLYGLGVAPGASIIAQRIFDGEGNYEAPPSFETLTHDAVRAGADIGSNSWGDDTQGRYDISAAEFDALVRDADSETGGDQPYILEFSAGNAGPAAQSVGSPAVAKNVIATGASQNDRFDFFIYADGSETMADFSSRGPCEDGRIKPDVVAPGTWIASLRSPLGNDDFAWATISDNYLYQGGTSQAGPQVSGAAAVFVNYYRYIHGGAKPSPALVKAALINSAVDMDDSFETDPIPNMDEGWGRVDLTELIGSPRGYLFVDQTQTLSTGQAFEQSLIVRSSDEPLKITIAYTDVPGFPGAIPALVNDLDLEVVAPDGRVFLGNQFDQGESIAGGAAGDPLNNVEAVHLSQPDPGEYIVRVRARNVVQDARRDTGAIDQDFGLVMSGDFPLPGTSVVILDRRAYTAASEIKIKVIATDLSAQPTVTVTARSTIDAPGESVLLRNSSAGVFTGRVATARGPAVAADNVLQIDHGNQIDVSITVNQQTYTATAMADLQAPVISQVSVTNRFARMVVSWVTDEPGTSIVRLGTDTTLSIAKTNLALTDFHEVAIDNLRARTTYYYHVSSADAAGNRSTNSGPLLTFTVPIPPTVLLVNAYEPDEITPEIPLSTYTSALNSIGVSYDIWDIEGGQSSPGTNDLRPYRVVLWRVSDSIGTSSTITGGEQAAIRQYLRDGGAFMFTSMEHLTRLGTSFKQDVLRVQSFREDVGVPEAIGVNDNPLTSGMDMVLDYSAYYTEFHELLGIDPDLSDTLILTPDAAPLLLAANSHEIAGLIYPRFGQVSTGRVVFLSFPLDAVPASGTFPNSRAGLLQRALDFLAPGQNGVGRIAFDSPSYTLPGLVSVEVADSDLAGSRQITIQLYSDTVTNPVSLVLYESIPEGVFRGSITVVSNTSPAGAGRLRARTGDMIHAQYYDASGFVNVNAAALIDTVLPAISNIEAEPEYVEATIFWETSKDTDALVQFGESTFLGRTGYDPELDTSHKVLITGLLPDRVYYYQVVSRDVAGNTTIDDNNGEFYTLRTLRAVVPPYFESFETGNTNWQVFDGDTQSSWTLGVPNNGVETEAHSPLNAWGSSLNGSFADGIDTFLISPPIDLTGGNSAKVNFWTSYDFSPQTESDVWDFGYLLILTNNTAPEIILGEYVDYSGGWYEEEVDLTPYLGNVVYLVWYHTLFALEGANRPGWLIDDVSVTLTNLPSGTIVISNNLAQANYFLSGPVSRTGRGFTVISNALLGQYALTFGGVQDYQTPPARTNTLTLGATVVFNGVYSMIDTNNNGMADTWETRHFGSASAGRTRAADTDHDGFTDYAEFMAGTNPNSTNSNLRLTPTFLSDGSLRLEWPTVTGRIYSVEGSTDAVTWRPVSTWMQSSGSPTVFTVPPYSAGAPYLFRLQVRP